MKTLIYLLLFLFVFQAQAVSQIRENQTNPSKAFESHYEQALEYISANLYAEGITSLQEAQSLAAEHNLKEQYLQATIELAETYRKTADFERGIDLLFQLGELSEYPLQEVKRLGRVAAIYHQIIPRESGVQWDSVTKYLNPAMTLSQEHNLVLELASLKNEYGYLIAHHQSPEAAIPYQMEAAQIYYNHGDKRNYAGVMTKALAQLVHHSQDFTTIDSLINTVLLEIEGKNWYTVEIELFRLIGYYKATHGDGAAGFEWDYKSLLSIIEQNRVLNTNKLKNLQVSYETEKFQTEAKANAKALDQQRARNRELIVYLSLVGFLVFLIAWLFYREHKTKKVIRRVNKELHTANEKYQMLMIESNHRIKNNLQMIISMLEYSSKDVNPENTRALKRMSGKIHTISALHKHLYSDVHNARVDLATYFKEIVNLYTDLSTGNIEVNEHFEEVSIQSERLVYFGLILNEMLSNTLEHNTAPLKEVYISTSKHDNAFQFEYRDDSAHESKDEGTGSLLIRQLVNRIGGQNMEFDPHNGQYKFRFYA